MKQTIFHDTAGVRVKTPWDITVMRQGRKTPLIVQGIGRLSVLKDRVIEAYPGATLKFTPMIA
ncbi:MAG: hypothetical protein Q8L09_02200 [Candidatus Moranbacteria bacterium]|nr:hypothetical protein [Candidatus Moranbacteria bacterium]